MRKIFLCLMVLCLFAVPVHAQCGANAALLPAYGVQTQTFSSGLFVQQPTVAVLAPSYGYGVGLGYGGVQGIGGGVSVGAFPGYGVGVGVGGFRGVGVGVGGFGGVNVNVNSRRGFFGGRTRVVVR